MAFTTEILADYALGVRPEEIPTAARETLQRCLLDLIGSAAAGYASDAARMARGSAKRLAASGAADIWFDGSRLRAAGAAFANSTAASALDLDDGHRAAGGHPGAAVIPAVLAVAQEVSAVWPEILAALVAGYEIGVRVAAARDVAALDTLATGRWCAYGVAAAAGRLCRLNRRRTAEAMALAGVLSPGLSAAGYSRVMGNHAKEGIPWAVLTGLWAVELAAEGFTGPLDILDHTGYYDASRIAAGLGESFAVAGVYFKPYACCRWIHAALDGLLGLMRDHRLTAAAIDAIVVHTFERALRLNNYTDPESLESAQYSLPFCLAAAALEGRNGLLPMDARLLHRPDIVALAERVSLHIDPAVEGMFPARAAARVVLQAGENRLESVCQDPWGDPANPMPWEALVEKFTLLTRGVFPKSRQAEIIAAVQALPVRGSASLQELLASAVSSTFASRGNS